MHILYLDDSGSAGNPTEDYFVLAGVSVPEQRVRWLSNELEKLAATFDPLNSKDVEFHASHIFSARRPPWNRLRTKQERVAAINSVLHTLDNAYNDVVVFACAIHKASYPLLDPVAMAFEEISDRFNFYLRDLTPDPDASRELGLIVLDKSTHETTLQGLASNFRRDGNRWGNQLRHIIEVPLFIDSSACRITQLADHIAYAVFRHYNANDLTYFKTFAHRFNRDRESDVIHGLVHKHTTGRNCMCPACLSRR